MKFQACSLVMVSISMLFACASAARFGPHDCVNLVKSQAGSCVLRTDCVGIDTSKFEFSFDCETSPGERLRHSFGVGGFDDQEEFDTSIKCSKCIAPETGITTALGAHKEVAPHPKQQTEAKERMDTRGVVPEETPVHVHFLSNAADSKKEEAQVVKYGPENCVSTWRDEKTGNCQVKTNCKGIDTTTYMFGLICANDDGKVRHLFGKDSFDSEETFDSLIPCKTCLALDNVTKATELEAENAELATEINSLATEVGALKTTYQGIEKDVSKMNEAVAAKEKGGGEKKEEKAEEKKDGGEEKKEEGEKKDEGEEKKEEGEEKKEEEKKDKEEKDEGEAAKTGFFLTDRDVDETYENIAKSHLKGRTAHVKKQHSGNQQKRRQRHQKSHDVEAEDDDDNAEDEEATTQGNFRRASQTREEKEDNSDDSDDSSEDENDD